MLFRHEVCLQEDDLYEWLKLWVVGTEPVNRACYIISGVGLAFFKYAVGASLLWFGLGRV